MLKGKNVLVTGGCGFLGSNIIKGLLKLGANVRATMHQREPLIKDSKIEYLQCDLLSMDDCQKAVCDMEYVFMAAAFSSGAAVIKESPVKLVTPNTVMNTQMLEASYTAGVNKFVFISSSVVYPPSGTSFCKEDEVFSNDPPDIYFAPAWMKRYGEILCRFYAEKLEKSMSTVVVRPANIYGPFDNFDLKTSHVMAATIRKIAERQNPINVWGTGEDIRDFIFIDDFIEGLFKATEKINDFNPVNIASGKGYSIKQILDILIKLDNFSDAVINFQPSKPSMIPIRLLDTQKAEELLGFKAKTSIEEGMAATLEWYNRAT